MFNLKRLIFTMFIVLIGGFAYSQSGYVYNESLPVNAIASRSIFVCSDNSVVVLSNVDNTEEEWCTYYSTITKLDPDGNLLWRQWLNPGGFPPCAITGVDIDAEDTVTFILIGDEISLGTIDSEGVVATLSVLIDMDIPYFTKSFNKALRTPNNEIVAVGKAYQDYIFYELSSACYFRFSSAGDTLATAFWPVDPDSPYHQAEAYDLALMDNGNILIACRLHSFNCSILEVNPDGTLVNRFDLPGQFHSPNVSICRELNSPSYIIAYAMGEYPDYSIHVERFENGVFEPLFSISGSNLTAVDSMILGTDNIYLCGAIIGGGTLLSLTYSGELNWSWEQLGSNFSSVERYGSASAALLALDNDNCIYWAWSGGLRGSQVITKLLPNGQLPIDDEVQAPPVNTISAYPNPMKDEVTIKIKQDVQSPITDNSIDIFNIKGQFVRSLKLTKGETVWDGKDSGGKPCPKGIYLLRYQYGRGQITKICKTR
ncbi:MAG: T9SS type A sorting domain-containing protein [Candidatus Cloacimonetes bacterium]|nr:T9SS type A sorting domain-containing protein [Candidatus Cloacimonadota bacterium]